MAAKGAIKKYRASTKLKGFSVNRGAHFPSLQPPLAPLLSAASDKSSMPTRNQAVATEAMSEAPKSGGELFIVDNSDENWKGLKYLQDWTEIASAFDIATGYFEIGSLLALDGQWQKLDKIRILMGNEVTARTRQVILDGLKQDITARLDASIE